MLEFFIREGRGPSAWNDIIYGPSPAAAPVLLLLLFPQQKRPLLNWYPATHERTQKNSKRERTKIEPKVERWKIQVIEEGKKRRGEKREKKCYNRHLRRIRLFRVLSLLPCQQFLAGERKFGLKILFSFSERGGGTGGRLWKLQKEIYQGLLYPTLFPASNIKYSSIIVFEPPRALGCQQRHNRGWGGGIGNFWQIRPKRRQKQGGRRRGEAPSSSSSSVFFACWDASSSSKKGQPGLSSGLEGKEGREPNHKKKLKWFFRRKNSC